MHLFISAGEPSGDLHGSNLTRAIRRADPSARVVGFGGDRMTAAGADLVYPLANLAVMGLRRVLANLRTFFRLGGQAADYFRTHRPDAVVLIDCPGFHLPLARRAHAAGVPVYFFVPPQLWAWKSWRVKQVRRHFDTVLTALPFEEQWYRARGVQTHYVGHPYYDELAAQQLDPAFLAAERARGGPVVALLPGSRNQEVAANTPLMLAVARRVHAARPDVRFLVAGYNEPQAAAVREAVRVANLPVDVHVGRTPEIIELADACVAVSGSVGLEMMYRLKPAVIVYRLGRFTNWLVRRLVHVKYMSLVNLLAGEEVYPEFATPRDESVAIAGHVLRWLNDPAAAAATVEKLRQIKAAVAAPGACERAAAFLQRAVPARTARPAA
ncbi:MAG: lipid-A-disaccharide synthase [Gemmataceae bacterium]|nr:lipid-A-disaccharide synthase [Gemmataceae bacterium]